MQNGDKATLVEKEGPAFIKASKNRITTRGEKSLDQRRHLYPIMKLCMICLILAMKKKTNKITNTVSGLIVIAQERFVQIKA
jgi:hypothetical protein